MIYTLIDLYLSNNTYDNVTLGNFDGVHLGHQKLLEELLNNDGKNLVIMFNQPYDNIFSSFENTNKIQTICKDKVDIIDICLDDVYKNISHIKFKDFLKKLNIKKILVGKDFKFGYNKEGNIKYLENFFELNVIDFFEKDSEKISTSTIKNYLKEGNIEEVESLLGSKYYVKGRVIKGNQIGRTLSFPTLNIKSNEFIPKFGVYKTITEINSKKYSSITNVGMRPTVNAKEILIEAHVLDGFNEEIYGQNVVIYFVKFIREEIAFANLEELKVQIKKDIKSVKE